MNHTAENAKNGVRRVRLRIAEIEALAGTRPPAYLAALMSASHPHPDRTTLTIDINTLNDLKRLHGVITPDATCCGG